MAVCECSCFVSCVFPVMQESVPLFVQETQDPERYCHYNVTWPSQAPPLDPCSNPLTVLDGSMVALCMARHGAPRRCRTDCPLYSPMLSLGGMDGRPYPTLISCFTRASLWCSGQVPWEWWEL